jgi:hypothetical protein
LKPREEKTLTLPNAAIAELMEAVLEKGGLIGFRAHGTSMTPFLRDGDTLTFAPLANRQPRLGDVVAFSRPTEREPTLVVHRVVGRQKTGLVIQGDGNGQAPEIIPSESMLGRLVKAERDGRQFHLGLGPERRLIAWLSRTGLLWSLLWPIWCEVRQFFKR